MALPAVGWCAFALVVHTTTAKLLQQHKRWLMAFGPWSDSVLLLAQSCAFATVAQWVKTNYEIVFLLFRIFFLQLDLLHKKSNLLMVG